MDRVERHDVYNALGLAVVLLVMALALVFGARTLFRTVNGEIVDTSRSDTATEDGEPDDAETGGSTSTSSSSTTTTLPEPHSPDQVVVRVGNGARLTGVAGAGTEIVKQGGYQVLTAKNAPATDRSIVYYVPGYEADAAAVALLLNIAESQTAPMPADPGVPQDSALVVVILGSDTTLGSQG